MQASFSIASHILITYVRVYLPLLILQLIQFTLSGRNERKYISFYPSLVLIKVHIKWATFCTRFSMPLIRTVYNYLFVINHDGELKTNVSLKLLILFYVGGKKNWFDQVCSTHFIISRQTTFCLLYTSPSPRDATLSRMPSSA